MHGENRQVQQTPVLIISLVKNPAKDKTWDPIQMIWLQCFHVLFCSCYYSVGGGDQLVPSTILRHIRQPTFSSTWHHRIWMFLFLVIIIWLGNDTQGSLKDYWTGMNSSWHHFTTSKHLYMTGSYIVFDVSTFQTVTMLLTIMTQTMKDHGK
jgi:hypothetical protein